MYDILCHSCLQFLRGGQKLAGNGVSAVWTVPKHNGGAGPCESEHYWCSQQQGTGSQLHHVLPVSG